MITIYKHKFLNEVNLLVEGETLYLQFPGQAQRYIGTLLDFRQLADFCNEVFAAKELEKRG